MKDFSGLSSKVSLFSSSDPYDGSYMTNPTVPEICRATYHKWITLEKHVVIGAGSVILPGVTIAENVAIGAMSLVRKSITDANSIYAGNPIRRIGERKVTLLNMEQWIQ
jgi:galactoside O-acetyltransferase